MTASRTGHLNGGNKGRFCCSRAFKCNHDNSRRCSFGTRPSPFAENDHFEPKLPICDPFIIVNEGVVSKETVVLRRWGSSIQKFGFINGVDNVNWPPYRDSKS